MKNDFLFLKNLIHTEMKDVDFYEDKRITLKS